MFQEQGGELVGMLQGANAPLLQKMIIEKLNQEKRVLEKGGERKVVRFHNTHSYPVTHVKYKVCFRNFVFSSQEKSKCL